MKMIQVGIDLGTTNSLVATEIKGKIKILKFANSDMLKSVLFYDGKEILIGDKARSKGLLNPKNEIRSSKTHIGDFNKTWQIKDKIFTPTDVAAEILSEIKDRVCSYLKLDKADVIEAVITVPAYFSSNQIDETKKAGEQAGLIVKSIITEPVAAAIAYGQKLDTDETLFVIDLGGGTFDVSILEAANSEQFYDTIAVEGDKNLGGDDFDKKILHLFLEEIKSQKGVDLSTFQSSGFNDEDEYLKTMAQLINESENTKIELSSVEEYDVSIATLTPDYNFEFTVTRTAFEKECSKLFLEIEDTIKSCLADAKEKDGLELSDIDRIILAGGSSYMPAIHAITHRIFGQKPSFDTNLFELVVVGAALYAAKNDSMMKISDIISHSLGIKVINESNQSELSKLLFKNDTYPCSKEEMFTTTTDNQEEVAIEIFEGEIVDDVEANEFYGELILEGIEDAPAGEPEIKVKFEFDSNRILTVTAEDLTTGSQKRVQIKKGFRTENKQANVEIVFAVDTTGSMNSYIEGIFSTCINFAQIISEKNISYKLGLVGFGDEIIGEVTTVYPLTSDVNLFKANVRNCPRTQGGDEPESQFEGLVSAVSLLKNNSAQKIVILVSDAHAHCLDETGNGNYYVDDILNLIQNEDVTVYCVTPNIWYYKEFAEISNGEHFLINDYAQFTSILNEIAVKISGLKKL